MPALQNSKGNAVLILVLQYRQSPLKLNYTKQHLQQREMRRKKYASNDPPLFIEKTASGCNHRNHCELCKHCKGTFRMNSEFSHLHKQFCRVCVSECNVDKWHKKIHAQEFQCLLTEPQLSSYAHRF